MTDASEVFISYSSRDGEWVDCLGRSLLARGVRVWRDSGNIRPGDQFPDALSQALQHCETVALVVSSHSVASEWVHWEIERVQSQRPNARIIPIRIDETSIFPELSETHSLDFRTPSFFESQVDKLVWSGIRGTPLVCLVLHGTGSMPWPMLQRWMEQAEVPVHVADYVELGESTATMLIQGGYRVICVVDPFEDWPSEGVRLRSPSQYTEAIFAIRESINLTNRAVPFILYSHPGALSQMKHGLSSAASTRLSHYYFIPKRSPDGPTFVVNVDSEFAALALAARAAWTKSQRLLSNSIIRARSGDE